MVDELHVEGLAQHGALMRVGPSEDLHEPAELPGLRFDLTPGQRPPCHPLADHGVQPVALRLDLPEPWNHEARIRRRSRSTPAAVLAVTSCAQ